MPLQLSAEILSVDRKKLPIPSSVQARMPQVPLSAQGPLLSPEEVFLFANDYLTHAVGLTPDTVNV